MIGFDTNVLVRYIVQDDPVQADAATRLIESRCTAQTPGYVSALVLMELVWVLTTAYRYEKPTIAAVIAQILRAAEFMVEDRDTVWAALRTCEARAAEFADCLIAARNHAHGVAETYTFDRRAARERNMTLVP